MSFIAPFKKQNAQIKRRITEHKSENSKQKLKSQNTYITSYKHNTQNSLTQNTMSHLGFWREHTRHKNDLTRNEITEQHPTKTE